MRTIFRGLAVTLLLAFIAVPVGSQESKRMTKRAPTLVVSLGPAFGYTPLGGPLGLEESPGPTPEQYARARELFHFQIIANRPDDPGGDLPTTVVAQGFVRRGEAKVVRGGYKDMSVTGTISLKSRGVAKYEAELAIDGRPVSSTAATLLLDAVR
ncbi:MAG: hypothetical protein M3167_00160 [Acidobacteriota bacterium]|nr:hypothetical protein [Acidobacteriota bacterium]